MATVVKEDSKAPFSIATTLRFWGGHDIFPLITPLYPWYIPYNAVLSKEGSSTIFLNLWSDSTRHWTCGLPGHWRTLYSLGQWAGFSRWSKCCLSRYQLCNRHSKWIIHANASVVSFEGYYISGCSRRIDKEQLKVNGSL